MRKSLFFILTFMFMSGIASAQFKSQAEQPGVSRSIVQPSSGISSFLGLINPNNLIMRHNVSLSYLSAGGAGMSLASYTNSMFYKISDPLNVRFDLTLQGSPFGQVPYQSNFGGLFLSRAELNYRPWENFLIKFEYNRLPYNFYGRFNPWYNPYGFSAWGDE